MALTDYLTEDEIGEIKGKPFGIDFKGKYDREEFVKRAEDLFNVEEYYSKLRENSSDIGALNDLMGIAIEYMADDKRKNIALLQKNPHLALEQGEILYSAGSYSMAKFVENNRNEFLDRLSVEQLYSLFRRVPLYKTEDKKYERIRGLREKVMLIQEVGRKGGDIGSVVEEELKELMEKVPDEQKGFIVRNQIPSLIKTLAEYIQKAFVSLFRDEEGKLDKSALRRFLEDNYKVAEDFIDKEIPNDKPKEKEKYWNDNLKTQYVEVARELYGSEKKEERKDKDKDKEERKDKAKNLGLET